MVGFLYGIISEKVATCIYIYSLAIRPYVNKSLKIPMGVDTISKSYTVKGAVIVYISKLVI